MGCCARQQTQAPWHGCPPRCEHMCELMWHGCKRGGIGGRGNNKSLVSKMASQPDQWSGLPGSRHKLPGRGDPNYEHIDVVQMNKPVVRPREFLRITGPPRAFQINNNNNNRRLVTLAEHTSDHGISD